MDPLWPLLTRSLLLATVAIAAVTDLRSGKIYNALTVPAAALGLLLHALAGGWGGLGESLQGLLLGFLPLLLGAALGQFMAGGDIKLLMALGALAGPTLFLQLLVLSILAGGLLALLLALHRRALGASCRRLAAALYGRMVVGLTPVPGPEPGALTLPYAVPIAVGTLAAVCYFPL